MQIILEKFALLKAFGSYFWSEFSQKCWASKLAKRNISHKESLSGKLMLCLSCKIRKMRGNFYFRALQLLLKLVCVFISQFAYFLSSYSLLHPHFLLRTTIKLHLQLICYAQKCNLDSLRKAASF